MSSLIEHLFSRPEFKQKPPVLIDVGASGQIHEAWKKIAKYSICIAFDADAREFKVDTSNASYQKLFLFNRILSATPGNKKFYLTNFPFCSSLLKPDLASLRKWIFSEKFKIKKTKTLPTHTLSEIFKKTGITYVDWFKTDSQGTDLRLFKSIPQSIRNKIYIAEFEPGIIDAYIAEDKLHTLIKELGKNYFVDEITVKGSQRIAEDHAKKYFSKTALKYFHYFHKTSACWAEITFLREIDQIHNATLRDALLYTGVLLLRKQYAHALELSDQFYKQFNDEIFNVIRKHCLKKIKAGYFVFLATLPLRAILSILKKFR